MYGVKFSHKLSKRSASGMLVVALAVSALVAVAEYREAPLIARLDHLVLDALEVSWASAKPAQRTIVVDIDDQSLAALGQWPWPRYRVATLLGAIAAAHPAAIGMDVIFPEPDRSSLINVSEAFKRDFGLDLRFVGVPAGLTDNDGYLGEVLATTGVVGSKYFYFDHATAPFRSSEPGLRFGGRTDALALHEAPGILLDTEKVARGIRTSGFINNRLDEDGRLRSLPLLIRHDGVIHAHLALATVMSALATTEATVEASREGPMIRVGSHAIPIDENGYALLRFRGGPQDYRSLSAVDVLSGSFDASEIKGKIVFVGSSAVGLNDLHNTAVDPQFPGPKLQAVMAENIVNDDFLRMPVWAHAVAAAGCLIVGVASAMAFIVASGALAALIGSVVVAVVPLGAAALFFTHQGLFVSPAPLMLVVLILFPVLSVVRFAIARRQAFAWFKRLENAQQVTIESMAAVAETRDPETGAHIKRTQHYVKAIAEELRRSGHYADILTQEFIDLLFVSAPLHDIGKVGVSDHILLKPSTLTPEEFLHMKRHAEFGKRIILSTARFIDGENFLVIAGEIAATHHEKWDGTGYPAGLAGDAIPLSGRIMAVADIYDALISRRCYKEPYPHAEATKLMRAARSRTFDPVVLDAFLRIEAEVQRIASEYPDPVAPLDRGPAESKFGTDGRYVDVQMLDS